MLLVVPRDPLAPRRADEHFAPDGRVSDRPVGTPAELIGALPAGPAEMGP
jgi:hypothetical protein